MHRCRFQRSGARRWLGIGGKERGKRGGPIPPLTPSGGGLWRRGNEGRREAAAMAMVVALGNWRGERAVVAGVVVVEARLRGLFIGEERRWRRNAVAGRLAGISRPLIVADPPKLNQIKCANYHLNE